jgi:hypothetical protein
MATNSSGKSVLFTPGRLALSVALALCLSFMSDAQNSAISFTSSQPIPMAPRPFSYYTPLTYGAVCNILFAGKFHASSKTDFAGTCADSFSSNEFSTALLNQGNGTFTAIEDSAADSASAFVVAAADMNGDGFTDLVLNKAPGGQTTSTIGVQISNGDGTFKTPTYYDPSGHGGVSVIATVVGDFEDNSRMDVAVLTLNGANNVLNNFLTVFINDGSGKLTQSATYTLPSSTGNSQLFPLLIAGDLNGDHKTDLAYIDTTRETITPFLSEGNGKFTKGGTYSAGSKPFSAVIGNFNDDGYGNIAVATYTGVKVLIGDGRGSFPTSRFTPYPVPITDSAPNTGILPPGQSILAADFDKDGKVDIALIAPNDVYIFWGAGNGSFSNSSAYSMPSTPVSLVVSSINNNGRLDLAVAGADGSISILYNLGGRNFRATPNTHSPHATGIVAADFNGDGKKDIAVVDTPSCNAPCNGSVTVFPGEGSYFGAGKTYAIGMHGSAIAAGDLNGDGILDLVVTNATLGDNANTSILLGIKSGGFQPAHNITLGLPSNDAFLVDVNGDGKLDLVEDGGIALGDGKGDFGNLIPFPDGIGSGIDPDALLDTLIAVADFNGDGHPDVVALVNPTRGQEEAYVLVNDGKGQLTLNPLNGFDATFPNNGLLATSVSAGPVSGGSINDIVFGEFGGAKPGAYLFKNDGKGHFTPAKNITINNPGNFGLNAVVISDFNHDGYNDLGFSNGSQFFVATGPSFNAPTLFSAESGGPYADLAVADFNNDGWPDVVFTNPYGVARLYNVPVPTVTPGSLNFSSAGTKKVSIKNTLKTSQSITAAIVLQGTTPAGARSPFRISSNTCGTLAAGASCMITVEFSESTTATANLYVSANGQFIDAVAVSGN